MSKIQVRETNVPIYYLVKSFDINIIILDLTKSVDLTARCYDKNGDFLYQKSFSIVGEEYLNWSDDDNYLIDLVASKLGLEIDPVIPDVVIPDIVIPDPVISAPVISNSFVADPEIIPYVPDPIPDPIISGHIPEPENIALTFDELP